MRVRVKFGLAAGALLTIYSIVYAALKGGRHPLGLFVVAVVVALTSVVATLVTSWLIDRYTGRR
jgi:hypothetical protein